MKAQDGRDVVPIAPPERPRRIHMARPFTSNSSPGPLELTQGLRATRCPASLEPARGPLRLARGLKVSGQEVDTLMRSHDQQPAQHLRNSLLLLEMLARACTLGAVVPDLRRRIEELKGLLNEHGRQAELLISWFEDLDSGSVAALEQQLLDAGQVHRALVRRLELAGAGPTDPERAARVLAVVDDIRRHLDDEGAGEMLFAA